MKPSQADAGGVLLTVTIDDAELGGTLRDGRIVFAEPGGDHFATSDEFFTWLREHLVDEGHLTMAEEETCELLLLGRNYLEIATVREVSVETTKWHVKRILRKLGVDSTRELLWVVGHRIDRRAGA